MNIRHIFNTHAFFCLGTLFFPKQKPGGPGDTVEEGLGPRPLGPIGPMVQGPWGPWGPAWGMGKATYSQAKLPTVRQATYCQAKLPTVRQATYSQACTQPIHRHAPKRHRHAPKSLHRLAPNNRILCTQPLHRHAPKRRIHAPKSSRIHAPKLCVFLKILKVCRMAQDLSKSVPMVFRSPGKALIKLFHFIFNSKCHFLKVSFC